MGSAEEVCTSSHQKLRVPCEQPPFTLSMLRKAIPAHCFQRSLLRSSSYALFDISVCCTLFYVAETCIPFLPIPLNYVAWPFYWLIMGEFMTALWVIGHECGHNAFSEYQWVDNLVGLVVHSALLFPFFSFKYTHGRHHSNNGSLSQDEVFLPRLKNSVPWYFKHLDNPAGRVIRIVCLLVFTLPSYLLFNTFGRKYDGFANHFNPYSPKFTDRERLQVVVSDAGIFTALYVYYRVSKAYGFAWFSCTYLAPLFIMFVLVTAGMYLQHTHPTLPHYDDSEWEWLRGVFCTVDLDFGYWVNKITHNSANTHTCHHLFPTLPHYHAIEATEAIKPILGDYYQVDSTPPLMMLYRAIKECVYADQDQDSKGKGVYWYRPHKHEI
ncbi:hypothetical protein Tsubulata_044800 [Turnera subulata]|uniref:Fatty acid desaturase domain-containing protein n=1 Tax=Turnera subulata TaxID=218843 RepID=A0A9Q0G1S2_9ROSI|nr:hypothetical protein Tsubulata_044800 [Turnera subulata]